MLYAGRYVGCYAGRYAGRHEIFYSGCYVEMRDAVCGAISISILNSHLKIPILTINFKSQFKKPF
jgi:hypothetical protein